jgi:glycosyltransferase involved in cell wall biosynthesis
MMNAPLVSVVMPTRNQAQFIDEAIGSVLQQSYPNIELIIADGASTDGTVELLRAHSARHPNIHWFSRPDRGPAHAINDALLAVRGTYVGWLNSDDIFAPGAISRALTALTSSNYAMVYGHGQHLDKSGTPLDRYPTKMPPVDIQDFRQGCFICQPTVFLRKSAITLLGPLDESYATAFDFEYWLRAFSYFADRIGFVDAIQAYSRLYPECLTLRLRRTVALEGMRAIASHLGDAPKEWILTYFEELTQTLGCDEHASLQDTITSALNEAKAYMTATETRALADELELRLQKRYHPREY